MQVPRFCDLQLTTLVTQIHDVQLIDIIRVYLMAANATASNVQLFVFNLDPDCGGDGHCLVAGERHEDVTSHLIKHKTDRRLTVFRRSNYIIDRTSGNAHKKYRS